MVKYTKNNEYKNTKKYSLKRDNRKIKKFRLLISPRIGDFLQKNHQKITKKYRKNIKNQKIVLKNKHMARGESHLHHTWPKIKKISPNFISPNFSKTPIPI